MSSTSENAIVSVSGLVFEWPGRSEFKLYIDDFELRSGSRTLLVGPSGGGKTTFLSLLCGIVAPCEGSIKVLDQDFGRMRGAQRDRFRADHFGVVFQMFNLLPYGSVMDNITLPLSFSPLRRARVLAAGGVEAEVRRLAVRLGLDEAVLEDMATGHLSVGQQQRVAAARALIGRPDLIVADEPTSALDQRNQAKFLDLLFGEVESVGATLVVVSHDESLGRLFDTTRSMSEFARAVPARSEL